MDRTATRPAGLYVVGIGTMLFGLLGLCTQGFGIFSAITQRDLLGSSVGMEDMQGEPMVDGIVRLQEVSFLPSVISAVLGVLVAVTLMVFGALTLARLRIALVTPVVLLVAAGVELLQLALMAWIQFQTAALMGDMIGGAGISGTGLESMGSAMLGAGLCIGAAWAVGKCAFFGAGAAYLRKPEIQVLFGGEAVLSARGD